MDFVKGLLRTLKGHDTIWVIVNHMTNSAYFLPVETTFSLCNMLSYTLMRSSDSMVFQYLSYLIVAFNLLHISRKLPTGPKDPIIRERLLAA